MLLKGIFKEAHPIIQLIFLLAITFAGALIFSFIGVAWIFFKSGFSIEMMTEITTNIADYPDYARELQFFSQLGTFIFPALLAAYLFSDNYKEYLQLDTPFNWPVILWTIVSMLVAIPFLNCVTYFNQQVVFPEALSGLEELLKRMEEENARFMESILYTDNTMAFIFNILIIAVFAGVGEEFMFRGVLQNIFGRIIRNKHILIWTIAVIFSAIHFQFYGFVTRALLGAYLGYLIYYTKNMWVPVLAHFTNNFVSVVLFRVYQDKPLEMEELDTIGYGSTWWLSVASVALFVFAFWQIKKRSVSQDFAS